MKLHERLRAIRKHNGLTLRELSLAAGLSVPFLSNIENDAANPSIDTLRKLANAYKMSFPRLFAGVDNMGQTHWAKWPQGFAEFLNDPDYLDDVPDDWREFLLDLNYKGKRPETKRDWEHVHLTLSRIFR